jgi:hypothetical protein
MSDKDKPQAIAKGRYAIYQTASGDGVITYRPDGEEADSHQVVPRAIWSIIGKALRGEPVDMNPVTLMKMFMGAKRG